MTPPNASAPVSHWSFYARLLGPCVLGVLVWRIETEQVLQVLRNSHLGLLGLAVLLMIPHLFLRGMRWWFFVRQQGVSLSVGHALNVYAHAVFLGSVTPGRSGEFLKVFYLKKHGISMGAGMVSVFYDRLLDLFVLFLIGTLAVLYWFIQSYIFLFSLLIAISMALIFLWVMRHRLPILHSLKWVAHQLQNFLPQKVHYFTQEFLEGHRKLQGRNVWGWTFLLTVLAWLLCFLAFAELAQAMELQLSFFLVAGLTAVTNLVAILPVTIMGLGTREAILIFILGFYGIPSSQALAYGMLQFLLALVVAILCGISLLLPLDRL
ncbi:MAG: flippase-like domain-containing protein [Magnetococcus sp. DMHC-6]